MWRFNVLKKFTGKGVDKREMGAYNALQQQNTANL